MSTVAVTQEDIWWLESQMYLANQRGQHEPQERITRVLLALSNHQSTAALQARLDAAEGRMEAYHHHLSEVCAECYAGEGHDAFLAAMEFLSAQNALTRATDGGEVRQ